MSFFKFLLYQYRCFRYPTYKKKYAILKEKERILTSPRYTEGIFRLLDFPLKFVDGASCHFIYQEIFEKEIYKFTTRSDQPFIIDAGANIGLSILYFKKIFPKAIIVAFEPDPKVYDVLSYNLKPFDLHDVTILNKALWDKETVVDFFDEGADAGRISTMHHKENLIRVPAVSLRNFLLDRKVDFLKVDIEGAETIVLRNCSDLLKNVERLFVEYHSFVDQEQTLPELLDILKNAGFRLSISSPGLKSRSPFVEIGSYNGMDMQLNIYGVRT